MTQQFAIPQPPSEIFSAPRTGHLLNEKSHTYIIEKMEAVEHSGIQITYQNVPYVKRGFPTPEAIYAINQVKRILLELCKLAQNPLILIGLFTKKKERLCEHFNSVFEKTAGMHAIKEEFMCRSAYNFAQFLNALAREAGVPNSTAKTFAFNMAQILEYDDAYRFRFQDICTELNTVAFKESPSKETKRLMKVFTERCEDFLPQKLAPVMYLLRVVTFFKGKKLAKYIGFLEHAKLDEHDRYWVCLRNDNYNYLGLSVRERHELYTERPIAIETTA